MLGWTNAAIGQERLDALRFDTANQKFSLRWPTKYSYNRCRNFYRDVSTTTIWTRGLGTESLEGKTIWNVKEDGLLKNGDLQHGGFLHEFPRLWAFTEALYRRLKHEEYGPEAIADMTIAANGCWAKMFFVSGSGSWG